MFKRIAFFTYGSLSYLLFLGTFLYAIGFIGNFGVPRTLDGTPGKSLGIALLINVGLLTLFAVQHSVMARKGFKDWRTARCAEAAGAIDLRFVFESRAYPVVLAVAAVGWCRMVH